MNVHVARIAGFVCLGVRSAPPFAFATCLGIAAGCSGAPAEPTSQRILPLRHAAVPLAARGTLSSTQPKTSTSESVHPQGEALQQPTSALNVNYNGGAVISNVHVVPVFWGGSNVNATVRSEIQCFYDAVVRSPYIDWLSEYATPNQQIGRGSPTNAGVPINPSHTGTSLSDDDIRSELANQIDLHVLPPPDANTVYMVYFPPGIGMTNSSGAASCVSGGSFCGYHDSFGHNGQSVRYGVFPDYAPGGPCSGAVCGGGDLFENVAISSTHELMEAVTDPDPNSGWAGAGGEIGDPCAFEAAELPGTYYSVQALWSNSRSACFAPSSGTTTVDPPIVANIDPSQGAFDTNTYALITGSCFANASGEISMNGSVYQPSPLTISGSFDKLDVTVPSSPSGIVGPATIAISNGGASALLPFTYQPTHSATLSPSDGPMQGGTAVTIQGEGFPSSGYDASIGVSFGELPATSVTCTSSTTCVAYPPAHDPGPVTVTLDVNGLTETVASQYTFDGPRITSVTPSFGPIGGGTFVQVEGTNMADLSEGAFVAQASFGGVTMSVGCAREGQYDASCSMTSPSLPSLPSNPADIQIQIIHTTGTTMWTPIVPEDQFTYTQLPAATALSFPSAASGGGTVNGTVQLNGNAPTGGSLVSLSPAPASPAGVVQFPSSVLVPVGQMSQSFPVTVINQNYTGTVSIVATYAGTTASGSLSVYPTGAPAISASVPLCAGNTASGTITLAAPAPAGGGVIALASDSGFASVPATVTIPAGATSASFPITIGNPSTTLTAHISGSYFGVGAVPATVSLLPSSAIWVSLPSPVTAGNTATGTVGVCTAAPAGTTAISLVSSSAEAKVSSVTIPAGATSLPFSVSTLASKTAQTVVITASDAASTATANLRVLPVIKPPPPSCKPGTCY